MEYPFTPNPVLGHRLSSNEKIQERGGARDPNVMALSHQPLDDCKYAKHQGNPGTQQQEQERQGQAMCQLLPGQAHLALPGDTGVWAEHSNVNVASGRGTCISRPGTAAPFKSNEAPASDISSA